MKVPNKPAVKDKPDVESLRGVLSEAPFPIKMTTLKYNGDSSSKVDIVIAGDGYTVYEIEKWKSDAARKMKELFKKEPFASYENYFNVHRVDVVSQESGAGWNQPFSKKNALGSYFNCNDIKRLLCVDNTAASRIIDSVLDYNQQDIKLIFVNDKRYGGSGGEYATTAIDGAGIDVVLHEIGHSFAGLADEYDSAGYPCDTSKEPSEPNVTIQANFSKVKWNNIPGTGIFEGAKYCKKGYYRPYKESKMRDSTAPWGELHLRSFRERIEGLGSGTINNNPNHEEPDTDTKRNSFNSGDLVLGYWITDGKWYPARIGTNKSDSYQVIWLDASVYSILPSSQIRFFNWDIGSPIECKWSGNSSFYPGKVASYEKNRLTIAWDDGDRPEEKKIKECRSH